MTFWRRVQTGPMVRVRYNIPIGHPYADTKICSRRSGAQQQSIEPESAPCGTFERGERQVTLAAVAVQTLL